MRLFIAVFISIFILSSASGCAASQKQIRLPDRDISAYANVVTKDDISIAIEILNKERTKEIFGLDLIRKGVQPVYIIIKNSSDTKYWFSKAASDEDYIAAREVPAKIYEGTFGRFLSHGTLGMIAWPFMIPGAIMDKRSADKTAKKIGSLSEEFNEIPDSHINPGKEIQGVMFMPYRPGEDLILKITNSKNLKKLLFEFKRPR